MRWKISPLSDSRPDHAPAARRPHDPRTMDLIAMAGLLALVLGSGWYLASSLATPPSTTAFIVPSQSVHW